MRHRLLSIALLPLLTSIAQAQSSSALINEALDKQIQIDLDTTLPQALAAITEKTAVPIRASKQVYDTLPWGEQTKLTAKISNQTLRQSLSAITAKLGLRFTVGDEAVELQPVPALIRIGRRSTIEELTALDTLSTLKLESNEGATITVAQLARQVGAELESAKTNYDVEDRSGDELGKAEIRIPKAGSLLDALEELHRQSRATWYPWGRSIVIIPKEELVRTLLAKPITMRWNGVDVAQVLTELSRRSGVEFTIEPGAVQRIPPESRVIKLVLENVSTRQALESISGFTGLGYVQNESGVYIWNPANSPVTRRPDRVQTIYTVDGIQVLLPDSEVPPDVKEFLQAKRQKAIQQLREQMKQEGFVPTTQPAE